MELIITTEPALAASAGMNSRVSRSAETTLASNPAWMASRPTEARSAMGGMARALYTSASTRPKASSGARPRAAHRDRPAQAGAYPGDHDHLVGQQHRLSSPLSLSPASAGRRPPG